MPWDDLGLQILEEFAEAQIAPDGAVARWAAYKAERARERDADRYGRNRLNPKWMARMRQRCREQRRRLKQDPVRSQRERELHRKREQKRRVAVRANAAMYARELSDRRHRYEVDLEWRKHQRALAAAGYKRKKADRKWLERRRKKAAATARQRYWAAKGTSAPPKRKYTVRPAHRREAA